MHPFDHDVLLGIDVGGTKVLGALVHRDGTVRETWSLPSRDERGADPGSEVTLRVAAELAARAGAAGLTITAVGAGFPEYISAGRLTSDEVVAWREQPGDLLARLLPGIPVVIESDVRCGALAEARLGAGAGLRSVLYISWGTGLSHTLVLDGVCVAGRRGEAIALGELGVPSVVDPGWRGNLERYASGQGMAERYTAATGVPVAGARELPGDSTARAVADSAGRALGTVADWLVSLLDPDLVVLGGGLGTSGAEVTRTAARRFAELTARRPLGPRMVTATLGPDAGVIGAALATQAPAAPAPDARSPTT
ncbi:ROK family protein [Streptosporangium sp. KLBMP 9127]|nr:ROK family protein [Streptosporangium sp. KLBMP 9127]